jgi:hypothetical protein
MRISLDPSEAGFGALNSLLEGLEKTGKRKDWGFVGWPLLNISPRTSGTVVFEGKRSFSYKVDVSLLNENNKTLGKNVITLKTGNLRFAAGDTMVLAPDGDMGFIRFPNIKADDLTPTLTIVINSVNGIPSRTLNSTGYMKIDAGDLEWKEVFKAQMNPSVFTYEADDYENIIITNYTGTQKIVRIPQQINGRTVVGINEKAFAEKSLTSVTIPNTVTSIGMVAFFGNNLTNVSIPDTVITIGSGAFARNKLTNIVIPSSVASIETMAFAQNRITSVSIPNSVTSIRELAFASNQLTNVVIPSSVKTIGIRAFDENDNLNTVTIGANVNLEGVRSGAFSNNFDDFYISNGKRAGTYVYSNRRWSLR